MTSKTTARNTSQKQSGGIEPSVLVQFGDQVTPTFFVIYTCPAGKQVLVNAFMNDISFPDKVNTADIKFRFKNNVVKQLNLNTATPVDDTGKEFQSINYILKGGEEIRVTTSNTTTARLQQCRVSVSVLNETPL